jgi:GT2 family glycosyltransferase
VWTGIKDGWRRQYFMMNPRMQWLTPDQAGTVDLAVIIVSWNVKDLLLENLRSLETSEGMATVRCLVVDNASSDGTAEAVRSAFPWVHVIANSENRGFAVANNQAIAQARGRHILLLNPDMRVEPDALQKTVDYLDQHPEAYVVGGKLTGSDGIIVKSVRRFPTLASQLAILFKLPHLFPGLIRRYLWSDFDYEQERAVDVIRGAFFALRDSALRQLGGLDERYFLWFEEVDYCRQVRALGKQVMYVPSIRAVDEVGQSFKQVRLFVSQDRLTRSLIAYFEKWQPRWQGWVLRCVRPFVLAMAWAAEGFLRMVGIKEYKRSKT